MALLSVVAWSQTTVPAPQTSVPAAQTAQPMPHATGQPPPTGQLPVSYDSPATAPANTAPDLRSIHLGEGDLVEVRVFGVPDLTSESRINTQGDVSLPLVGLVKVAGKTVEEAQHQIEQQLQDGGFLKSPHVTLTVKEYTTQGVSVMGEVQKPGIYPLMGVRRLFDAISVAGGLTQRAGREVTITRRSAPEIPIIVEVDNDPSKSVVGNVEIYPGDTVVVSRAGVVYVVGDVAHPAGFVMDNNEHVTVLQAIAMAGGTNGTAALNSAKIIRKTPTGLQETPIALKKILSAQGQDVALEPNDILFVPNSKAKGAARRSAEAVLSVATGLAIYRR